jgi:hypothetical protein
MEDVDYAVANVLVACIPREKDWENVESLEYVDAVRGQLGSRRVTSLALSRVNRDACDDLHHVLTGSPTEKNTKVGELRDILLTLFAGADLAVDPDEGEGSDEAEFVEGYPRSASKVAHLVPAVHPSRPDDALRVLLLGLFPEVKAKGFLAVFNEWGVTKVDELGEMTLAEMSNAPGGLPYLDLVRVRRVLHPPAPDDESATTPVQRKKGALPEGYAVPPAPFSPATQTIVRPAEWGLLPTRRSNAQATSVGVRPAERGQLPARPSASQAPPTGEGPTQRTRQMLKAYTAVVNGRGTSDKGLIPSSWNADHTRGVVRQMEDFNDATSLANTSGAAIKRLMEPGNFSL